ncbi:MAG: hypothetical protein LBN21_08940 [Treponema sp.]|nr:hypothetical protein [Treponema sp.]
MKKEPAKKDTKPDKSAKPPVKPGKPPASLKKPIAKKTFEKRYLKFLEHPGDKKFFADCFELKDDRYTLRAGFTAAEAKKLKFLLKAIKKNRKGPINLVPLVFVAVVAAAAVFFFTVLLNPILETLVETGLETVFEAKADVDNFNLNLLKFNIGMKGVTVANRDSPMTNLFQLSETRIKLKPEAVLRGKIYIEEVRADSIRFGTARKVSGALPAKPAKAKKEKPPKEDAPPLIDLQNFDAVALLNREFDKLNTPKAYDTAAAFYNDTYSKYNDTYNNYANKVEEVKTQTETVQDRSKKLIADAQALSSIDYKNPQELKRIQDFIKEIDDVTKTVDEMTKTVQTTVNEVNDLATGIQTDIKGAEQLVKTAQNSVTDDLNHLKSYLDFGSGAGFAALEPTLREILSDTAEQYLDYGLRALEVFEKLKADAAAKPKKEPKPKKIAFKGRDVIFPTKAYPKFYLGILASDFTLDNWNWGLDLRGISSEPDLSGVPVTLALSLAEDSGALARTVAFNGSADFRTAAAGQYEAKLDARGFPVSLGGSELSQVGIGGFNGDAAMSLELAGRKDGAFSTGGDVGITSARLVDPAGTLAQAVDTAIQSAGEVRLGIQYAHFVDQADQFALTTNIGDLIVAALKKTAEVYAKKALDDLEKALKEKIAQYIDGKFVSQDELDALFKLVRGDKSALDTLKTGLDSRKKELDSKKNEFENKIKGAADQAVQQVADEAKQQADQAVKDALQGKTPSTPSTPVPSLPGGLKLPGR